MAKFIDIKYIPNDLNEMLEENDIMYTGGAIFDNAMIEHNFFDYGSIRRSHRVITDKATDLGYFGIIETLTGKTENQLNKIWKKESREKEIGLMIKYAEKYGYTLTKKEVS